MLHYAYDAYSAVRNAIVHPSTLLWWSSSEERGPPDCSSLADLLAQRDWETAFECMNMDPSKKHVFMESDFPAARLVATSQRHNLLTVVEVADFIVIVLMVVCVILMIGVWLLSAFVANIQRSKASKAPTKTKKE